MAFKFLRNKKILQTSYRNNFLMSFLNRYKLRNILIFSFVIMLIIPLVLIMVFSLGENKKILTDELSEALYESNRSTATLIGNNFHDITSIVPEILTDTEFEANMKILNQDKMNTDAHSWVLARMRSLRAKSISYQFDAVLVSTLDGEKHYGELIKSPFYNDPFSESSVQKKLSEFPTEIIVFPFLNDTHNYLVFGIKSTEMYIHIYKKLNDVENIYSNIDYKGGEAAIISEQRQYIISPDHINQQSLLEAIPPNQSGYTIKNIENTDYVISYNRIPDMPFYFISAVPLTHVYQKTNEVISTLLYVCAASVLITLFLGYFLSKLISNPISQLQRRMQTAEKGDLRVKVTIEGNSELSILSHSFQSMMKEFIGLIKEIINDTEILNKHTATINEISEKAQQISENNSRAFQEIDSSTQQQAASANECIYISNVLSEKIQNVIHFTSTIKEDIYSMVEMINRGFHNMQLIVKTSNETLTSSEKTMDSIKTLQNDADRINIITGIIRKNAQNSNMLAINAAIEAARAGEQGHGFSVVADEMGKLSDQIHNSAKEIETILEHVVESIYQVHNHSINSNDVIEKQIDLVNTSNGLFKEIHSLSDTALQHISGIDSVMDKMNESNSSTQASIQEISVKAQENAATTQMLSACTSEYESFVKALHNNIHQLNKLSNALVNSVNRFKI